VGFIDRFAPVHEFQEVDPVDLLAHNVLPVFELEMFDDFHHQWRVQFVDEVYFVFDFLHLVVFVHGDHFNCKNHVGVDQVGKLD